VNSISAIPCPKPTHHNTRLLRPEGTERDTTPGPEQAIPERKHYDDPLKFPGDGDRRTGGESIFDDLRPGGGGETKPRVATGPFPTTWPMAAKATPREAK